jgi:hypothetical protein
MRSLSRPVAAEKLAELNLPAGVAALDGTWKIRALPGQ